jgi:putative aldouronate transport system substrate-binding protein
MLASGTGLTDVIMGGIPTPLLIDFADQGVIIPITEYIETEAVWYQAALEQHPGVRALTTAPDGEIYTMQNITLALGNAISGRMWVNEPWLEALGLDHPTTTDEFADMLRAFRDQDPNGNGGAGVIPMMGNTDGWNTGFDLFLLNSFVQYNWEEPWRLNNGRVEAVINTEEYREGLRYLNMLVSEGLYDASSFTQDLSTWRQIFEFPDYPRIGALPSGGPTNFGSAGNEERRNMYVPISPLRGPNGFQHAHHDPFNNYTIFRNSFVVTHVAPNPRIAVKWADLFYEPETARRARWGVPGQDYFPADPGALNQFGNPAEWRPDLPWGAENNSHWHGEHQTLQNFARDGQAFDNPLAYPVSNEVIAAALYQQFVFSTDHYVPPMMFVPEDAARINEIRSLLDPFWEEARDMFAVGIMSLDNDWDNYVMELERMGLSELIEIMQRRFDILQASQ